MKKTILATAAILACAMSALTGCAGLDHAAAKIHEGMHGSTAHRSSPALGAASRAAGESSPARSTAAPDPNRELCRSAEQLALEGMQKSWRSTGSSDPGDRVTTFKASAWALQYQEAMSALSQHGCGAPPASLARLDRAVSDLQTALDAGWELYGVVPRVAQELRAASGPLGLQVPQGPITCRDLTQGVEASFVLLDDGDETGQSLFPRITVANRSDHPVVVSFDGEGRATSEFGDDMRMSWGGYTDSRVHAPAGTSRSLELGNDTGETLLVSDGQQLVSATMRAAVSSVDGALTDCRIPVPRTS